MRRITLSSGGPHAQAEFDERSGRPRPHTVVEELLLPRFSPFRNRDFYRIPNIPDDPDLAIEAGSRLCEELLEPLQATFGRLHIRSGYRSRAVNEFGNLNKLNCSTNAATAADHIWDMRDAHDCVGATACVVVPWLIDTYGRQEDWQRLAWWIHDHLPYASLCFFPKLWAFNIQWHERPARRISSYVAPRGVLTKPGMANHDGSHAEWYAGFPDLRR